MAFTYNTDDRLGSGAFSNVYAATDDAGRKLAAKVIQFRDREDDLQLAMREVEILGELKAKPNDHLVHAVDIALESDHLVLVMARADRTLADLIAEGPVPEAEVKNILIQIATGMESLALASVVHRDIKPTNVLELNGQWCLTDFGISRITSRARADHTWRATGTAEYRAPEVFRDQDETVRADLYSLGCIAYELITGVQAFPYADGDIRIRQLTEQPELPEGTDPTLRSVVAQLLNKEPAARPSDARQVREQLVASGRLSPEQSMLLGVRAVVDEREALSALGQSLQAANAERFRQAAVQVHALWARFVELLTEVFPTAEPEQIPGEFRVNFNGMSVSFLRFVGQGFHYAADLPELILVGEVKVRSGTIHGEATIANLYSLWVNDLPQLRIAQFEIEGYELPPGRDLVKLPRAANSHYMPRAYAEHGPTFGEIVISDELADANALLRYVAAYLQPLTGQ
ncbi:serine/threonine-protein kinase [Phytohabitans houttuyneae]|uniref:non-specific serine/threonine protein kinase n=1 Tax=Phytohabitans houttuyneae TaxID=1076126 RepID=A0A6V8KLT3_9ACTN|nr:serine/threonine-protein kinase [Phytohabitans houttuyneae]GFJ84824.1 hypothetical protein Phou_090040 [Phytohabitans houttuyneae]